MRQPSALLILCLSIIGVLTEAARPESDRRDSYGDKIEQERKNLEKLRGSIEEKRKKPMKWRKNGSPSCKGFSRWMSGWYDTGRSIRTSVKS